MVMPDRVMAAVRGAMTGKLCLMLVLLGGAGVPAQAEAGWFSRGPAAATTQVEGRWHKGPRGYHAMCAREPELCQHDYRAAMTAGQSAPAPLDAARWDQLRRVNRDLNWAIRPVADRGRDHWTLGTYRGDCEDYAIAKKHALIQAGWAPDQLLYAVVEGRASPYHLVLVVRTDRGDYVLDNLTDRIRPWADSGYRFVIRQTAADPTRWVTVPVHGERTAAMGLAGLVTR